MECGPKAVAGERLRKMVDDLDGKRELLGELVLLRAPGVCDAEVRSNALMLSCSSTQFSS